MTVCTNIHTTENCETIITRFFQKVTYKNGAISNKNIALHHGDVRYLHKPNTTSFIIVSIVNWTKCHLSSTVITEIILYGYVIHLSADVHCQQRRTAEDVKHVRLHANLVQNRVHAYMEYVEYAPRI